MGCLSDVACAGDLDFFNLPFLAERFLGDKIKAYKDIAPKGRTFLELPFEEMKEHAGAEVALQLHGFLESAMNERKIDQQFEERTLPLALTLHKVEKDGIHVDRKRLEQLRSRLEDSMLESKRCVSDGIGSEISLNSQDEISALMSEKGQPGMNGVDHDYLLLRVLIDESSHRLSTRFLVGRPHG
jgi:DNA polymerase-1